MAVSPQAEIDGNLIHANQREGIYISGSDSKALVHPRTPHSRTSKSHLEGLL